MASYIINHMHSNTTKNHTCSNIDMINDNSINYDNNDYNKNVVTIKYIKNISVYDITDGFTQH